MKTPEFACIVSFEVVKSSTAENLKREIWKFKHARINQTTYIVITDKLPVQLREMWEKHLAQFDRLFISRLGYRSAWIGYGEHKSYELQDLLSEKHIANGK